MYQRGRRTETKLSPDLSRRRMRSSLCRYPPEGAGDVLERPPRLVRPQAVSKQSDDVRACPRIGSEIAMTEKITRPAHLDDIDHTQPGNFFDLGRGQHGRVDAPEPRNASKEVARRFQRLVVGRNVERHVEPG